MRCSIKPLDFTDVVRHPSTMLRAGFEAVPFQSWFTVNAKMLINAKLIASLVGQLLRSCATSPGFNLYFQENLFAIKNPYRNKTDSHK